MALKFQFFLILNACLSNYQWSQYPLWQTKVSAEKRTTLLSKRFNLCGKKLKCCSWNSLPPIGNRFYGNTLTELKKIIGRGTSANEFYQYFSCIRKTKKPLNKSQYNNNQTSKSMGNYTMSAFKVITMIEITKVVPPLCFPYYRKIQPTWVFQSYIINV